MDLENIPIGALTSYEIHEGGYTDMLGTVLDFIPNMVLPSYLPFVTRLLLCVCSIVLRANPPTPSLLEVCGNHMAIITIC